MPSLIEAEEERGAVFASDSPAFFAPPSAPYLPVHFGDPANEYLLATTEAVLFAVTDREQMKVTGKDRHKFLNGFCTADIKGLEPGKGCEAFFPTIQGKVLGHGFLFAGEESLWMDTPYGMLEPLMPHLERYIITEDVKLHPDDEEREDWFGELFVSGPLATEKISAVMEEAASLSLLEHTDLTFENIPVSVRRVDWFHVPGYLLSISWDHVGECWNRLVNGGISPAGAAAFHAQRIASGFPLQGIDITADNLAQEVARTEPAINFKKGCYLGQEPIARIDAIGHVNRELRAVQLTGNALPTANARIQDSEGKEIGHVTSSAMHPTEKLTLALGYLKRNFLKAGQEVFVEIEGAPISAVVLETTP